MDVDYFSHAKTTNLIMMKFYRSIARDLEYYIGYFFPNIPTESQITWMKLRVSAKLL